MYQRVQNARIKNYFIDILKLNPIQDIIPDYVRQDIQPVAEVDKPFCNIIRRGQSTTTGDINVFTTPTDKDFYIYGVTLGFSKNATCDVATGTATSLFIVQDGISNAILSLPGITTTAERDSISISFPRPLKVDRGTSILCTGTFTAGVMARAVTIFGYTEIKGSV